VRERQEVRATFLCLFIVSLRCDAIVFSSSTSILDIISCLLPKFVFFSCFYCERARSLFPDVGAIKGMGLQPKGRSALLSLVANYFQQKKISDQKTYVISSPHAGHHFYCISTGKKSLNFLVSL
jgi:hypothetical protein